MSRLRSLALLALVAVVAGVAATSASAGTTECKGIKNCIDVVGPWVVVPAHGGSTYLAICPKKKSGTIGGLDAEATSADVHVTFDGLMGGPIAAGTTTTTSAYFRAFSAAGRVGEFQPRIGCLPTSSGGRQTTSARPVSPGPPVTFGATIIRVVSGAVTHAVLRCPRATRFVSSWSATSFATIQPPDPRLASAISVVRSDSTVASEVTVTTSRAVPAAAHAQVQLGVVCAA